MKSLFRWWRRRQRMCDARVLWPILLGLSNDSRSEFLHVAELHTSMDPAWRYADEWAGTGEDPSIWFDKEAKKP